MRINLFFLTVLVIGIFTHGNAMATTCYTEEQFESEQGLRIHSELMVIGLTCQKAPGGQGLYGQYQRFTVKNQYLLGQYENAMLAYFRQNTPNADVAFHDFRTGLANDISQKAIRMNTAAFCRHYQGRIDQALAMDHDTLRRWAQKRWPSQPPSRPLCSRY